MKLISFLVPAYNSEAYLDRCLLSLVGFGEDVEIIVVDDGSKDSTGEIADRYALEHSNVQVIHQENGGHGERRRVLQAYQRHHRRSDAAQLHLERQRLYQIRPAAQLG